MKSPISINSDDDDDNVEYKIYNLTGIQPWMLLLHSAGC